MDVLISASARKEVCNDDLFRVEDKCVDVGYERAVFDPENVAVGKKVFFSVVVWLFVLTVDWNESVVFNVASVGCSGAVVVGWALNERFCCRGDDVNEGGVA